MQLAEKQHLHQGHTSGKVLVRHVVRHHSSQTKSAKPCKQRSSLIRKQNIHFHLPVQMRQQKKTQTNGSTCTAMIAMVSAENSQASFFAKINSKNTPKQNELFMQAAPKSVENEMLMVCRKRNKAACYLLP